MTGALGACFEIWNLEFVCDLVLGISDLAKELVGWGFIPRHGGGI